MLETSGLAVKDDMSEISAIYHESYQLDSVDERAISAADAIGDVLVRTFAPKTSADFGCGGGALIRALERRGVDAVGVEGSVFGHRLHPHRILQHDLRSPLPDSFIKFHELVTCFDTAEHIEKEYADVLLRNLTSCTAPWGYLVFGPAPEGQDGLGHVNCQHPTFWISKLEALGFGLFASMSEKLREDIRADQRHNHLWWIAKNLMVFARRGLSHGGRVYTSEEHWKRSQASRS